MTTPSALCGALEIALNRFLALEPAALEECGRLKGRVIALHARTLDWEFFLCPHARGVQVFDRWDGKPDVRISAPPTALLRHALGGAGSIPAGVDVQGDAALLSRFAALLAGVGFDPEEWLAKALGDAAAHRAWQGLRGFFGWTRNTAATLGLDTVEYLREETRDLVHRADAEQWMDAVDHLRERADRFAARLARLESGAPPASRLPPPAR